ncbi:MAG: 50S ribosomal protein L32 [Omnitrophica WOR_2 bacterium GWF2_43_52]|nr:MAG: 50S ribosomal protein L32 [Omnitrophica WOR_2 bacterium GWC2_44_8]OGX21392.1 MAG: 50S ribosomal protein L32 [Omnitrophica WOR_2 bacterium GWF2_43_52]OGX54300.1 MAG: 50S ribosomal protein L32 [Omnitrophica WOR_2 bacterium RIFOXYC2_FULL_43_9]HAH21981.1 50S ribosomal protein L32 [Candidatus Omnitrophota bacterium]HBG62658.1 50S ribosomal protein L32 [Candidatus Omnitrophota bacterium]
MPLPKRRFSSARTRKKRAHKIFKMGELSVCPQCKQPKHSHQVCPVCGYYKGRQVLEIKIKEKKKKQG